MNTPSTSSISGTYQMKGGLVLTSDGSNPISVTSVYSQYYAPGDFDVQVDYALGPSWGQAIVASGSNPLLEGAAFQVYFDGQSSLTLFRARTTGADQLLVSGTVAGQQVYSSAPSSDQTGTLRIRRSGTQYEFMSLSGSSWITVGTWTGPVRPAVFGLLSANVNAMNSVTTTFQNFQINSGNTNFQPYQLPANPLPRSDFVPGFVSDDSITWIVWGGATGYDPFGIMAANGIGRARIMATTVSIPILENTPFSQWGTLPWIPTSWSSLQLSTQELLEARSLGMQTYMTLYLSDTAANAGVQNAPAAWQGLSLDDTAAAVQAYTYATASYLMNKGIKIDLWSPGNEIGTGILNFLPGQRLPAPQNASPYDAIDFMEQNVWPIEAQLLKAAIAGIRQVDPEAKIVLHIAGLTLSPADLWVKAFFTTMVNLGVPFDVAGVSLPYMGPGWTLPQYTTGCWYQKLNAVFRDIAALGKKGIISEAAYQNTTVNISANAPMADFPITPQGQAAWISSVLRFASNNPNVLGFNYTFPEAYPGVPGLDSPPPDIVAFSLFQNATTVQPGMLEFNPFLNTFKTPQINAVVNLANSQPGPLAPGEYATVYGDNLAGLPMAAQQVPFLPVLADVSVTVNGQPAPVQYASATQINFLVPYGTISGPATIIVSAGLQDSAPFTAAVQTAAPAIFMYNGNQAIAQDVPSLVLNGPSFPAAPGSAITVYVVGLGAMSTALGDGTASPTTPPATSAQTVTAAIGGQNASVLFAGLTPGLVGLGQVNLVIPQGLGPGNQPLVITVGNQASSPAMLSVGATQ
ncbi:MAG TPA: glycosyl hydrolase 53 family protein [Bryobacteraceae bacterium]|nr:glycosyl hydrolase 53 family protein [Bryobacteraceae bacterium]HUO29171.1 glycosyl hydrolase 53 family protein [Bryobacteraceae bacterium]